jgi:Arc/MetJ-type ribon-helix-helix transcriptional regulator
MGRPPPIEPVARKSVSLPVSVWERISEYRYENHFGSESEAIRRILLAGLDAEAKRAARALIRRRPARKAGRDSP